MKSEAKTPHPPDRSYLLGRPKGTNPTSHVAGHTLVRSLSRDRNRGVPGHRFAWTLRVTRCLLLVSCEGATASAAFPNTTGINEPNHKYLLLLRNSISESMHDHTTGARWMQVSEFGNPCGSATVTPMVNMEFVNHFYLLSTRFPCPLFNCYPLPVGHDKHPKQS